ncbi:MAG: hypothetical protein QG608_7 [Actinomycetota bacterium]|nr:hypothetical protein [Actinomycetota bacterium]
MKTENPTGRGREGSKAAVRRMLDSQAQLINLRPAWKAIGLDRSTFLHPGPPLEWERAGSLLRGSLMGAALLEGLADSPPEAEHLLSRSAGPAASGQPLLLEPGHRHGVVVPGAGIVTASTWLMELQDPTTGRRAWSPLHEGHGAALRHGAFAPETIHRLRWMHGVLAPMVQMAIWTVVENIGPIDVQEMLRETTFMGDEGHLNTRAGTLLLMRELVPAMLATASSAGFTSSDVADAANFICADEDFFCCLSLPVCKLAADAARGQPGSGLVVAMSSNGTDFGIQTAGTGHEWFVAPAPVPEPVERSENDRRQVAPVIGDAAIAETVGLGHCALAVSPRARSLLRVDLDTLASQIKRFEQICVSDNPALPLPALARSASPTGFDARDIRRTGLLPLLGSWSLGLVPGSGPLGVGVVEAPLETFETAVALLAPYDDAEDAPGSSGSTSSGSTSSGAGTAEGFDDLDDLPPTQEG